MFGKNPTSKNSKSKIFRGFSNMLYGKKQITGNAENRLKAF